MKFLYYEKMRWALVGFLAAIAVGGGRAKADLTCIQKADVPTPRLSHTSASVNGKIYVFGGGTSEPGSVMLSATEVYDPAAGTWTKKSDMTTARGWISPSSAIVDGKIYVIGGWDGSNMISTVEEYDPVTDIWTRKTDMPTRRCTLATVALDGKIYAIGGEHPDLPTIVGSEIVEEYQPITDTWKRKAAMPEGRWGLCASVVNGKIYAFGGRPGGFAAPEMFEYDPATDTWTRKADMPLATSQMASVVLGDKIIVIGGWHYSRKFPYTTVQVYDPETNTWRIEADAPFQRAAFSAEVVNNRIHVIGGTDRPHPCPATSSVYELAVAFPPDFNGDFRIDIEDLVSLIENWGGNEPLYDIGPKYNPDSNVDVLDLEVFMSYWEQEVYDPHFIAHWKLDEAEGDVAYRNAGNDAAVIGDAVWHPTGGQIDGALEFDGVDDYVATYFWLDPADGSLSVFAWVKGGEPGQVIISQAGNQNWLTLDAEGKLMTELAGTGSSAGPLLSQAVITDGNWHRVGLVWDGSNRMLCVDDAVVAEDAQGALEGSFAGLYIGCGKNMQPGTYFSGLIDDVRIYNRAVKP